MFLLMFWLECYVEPLQLQDLTIQAPYTIASDAHSRSHIHGGRSP